MNVISAKLMQCFRHIGGFGASWNTRCLLSTNMLSSRLAVIEMVGGLNCLAFTRYSIRMVMYLLQSRTFPSKMDVAAGWPGRQHNRTS